MLYITLTGEREGGCVGMGEDKYRSHMVSDREGEEIQWRYGTAPDYAIVNNLFQRERTREWPAGSAEEMVQNLVKTWEMELTHKTRLHHFRSIHPSNFFFSVNGKRRLSAEEALRRGSYNVLLESKMPAEKQGFRADVESFESSHGEFKRALPGGFAWEVLRLHSGPPEFAFKFRHWGYMDGPFKDHAPTGDLVQFFGMAFIKVDESLRVEEVEIFYDPGDLLGDLLKGPKLEEEEQFKIQQGISPAQKKKCPFSI